MNEESNEAFRVQTKHEPGTFYRYFMPGLLLFFFFFFLYLLRHNKLVDAAEEAQSCLNFVNEFVCHLRCDSNLNHEISLCMITFNKIELS